MTTLQKNSALVPITPTGATGGTISGFITTINAGVAQVALSGVFSSTFDNYKIIVNGGVGSAVQAIGFQLTGSAIGYYGSTIVAAYNSTTVSSNPTTADSLWRYAGVSGPNNNYLDLDVLGPNLAKTTAGTGAYINPSTTGNGGTFSGYHDGLTQFTGFSIIVGGTMTGGTIACYGYRKS